MDYKKEEAILAKEIAEKKMQNSDFVGARKIAQKAQELFPDLENISQLLTVCEVHCSSQNKVHGSGMMDWYGILGVERLADGTTVTKQYRKLALSLHPDKNKFAGAEAAFKLIGDAHRVLSNEGRRSIYDIKYRVLAKIACSPVTLDNNKEIKRKAAPLKERLQSKKCKPGECKVKRENAARLYHNDEKPNVDNDFQFNSNVGQGSNAYVCPDADFSDFEKNKADGCFAVDQIWAIYDSLEGMPRFYAKVRKVYSPGFKLRITWLDPKPDDQGKIDWCKKELPVACGKYKFGVSEDTTDRLMFSHQMHWMKGSGRFSCLMYPRKGETWALFRNWDISWSADPEKHKPYTFEFVEVLSDFDEDDGIGVAYLAKVKGFVCLFQQGEQHGILAFQMPPDELYRFSHRIPSFRMTGEEREGVPKGSFELDPATLPRCRRI